MAGIALRPDVLLPMLGGLLVSLLMKRSDVWANSFPHRRSVPAHELPACSPPLQTAGLKEVVLLGVIRAGDIPLCETHSLESYKHIR